MNKFALIAAIATTIIGSSLGSSLLQKNSQSGGAATASIGDVIGVFDWKSDPATEYSKECQVTGTVRYKLQTEAKVSGYVDGRAVDKNVGGIFVAGQVTNGVGYVDVNIGEYSEGACKVKSSSDLQLSKWEITIAPGYVLELSQE